MSLIHLSNQDLAILALEEGNIVGHTAKIFIVEPRGKTKLTASKLRSLVSARLGAAPRLRQHLLFTPLGISTPVWADDPAFDIDKHVQKVPTKGVVSEAKFRELCGQLMARRLDRQRPLWQLDVIEGLSRGRTGIVWRLHHAMADGASTLQLADAVLWSQQPGVEPERRDSWIPDPSPSRYQLVGDGVITSLKHTGSSIAGKLSTLTNPKLTARRLRAAPEIPHILLREFIPSGDESPLDADPSNSRRVAVATVPLSDVKAIEHAADIGATVNDVVLAAVGGGLERWLRKRNYVTHKLRIKVPANLNLHREHHSAEIGNHDSFILIDTSIEGVAPTQRLEQIAHETSERKREDPEAIDTFVNDLALLPKPLHSLVDRWMNSPRVFALNVSNVRGPDSQRFIGGHRISEFFSLAEIGQRHALRVAVFSYDGKLSFGLCADGEAVPDVEIIAHGIEQEIAALKRAYKL